MSFTGLSATKGAYSDSGEWNQTISDSEIELGTSSDSSYYNVYGESYKASFSTTNPNHLEGENGKYNIFGLPMNFNKQSDPNGRVFNKYILANAPIVYLIPGVGKLNNKLVTFDKTSISAGKLYSQFMAKGSSSLDSEGVIAGIKGVRSGKDLRFMSFSASYRKYFKYVQVMANTIWQTMGFSSKTGDSYFDFGDYYNQKPANKYGICYYVSASGTSVSEGNNNDYSQSSIITKANDNSALLREFRTLMGKDSSLAGGLFTTAKKKLEEVFNGKDGEDIEDAKGAFDRMGQLLSRTTNGSQLLYPDIWSDSSFDKSINLAFKFYSPYGDKESIFYNVYLPFITLFCMGMPVQDNLYGYAQPYYVKALSPGFFESSMAAITSMSWTFGGSEQLWTIDGLPRCIEMQLSLKDLYPQMAITHKYGQLNYNLGFASFMDCLAGVRSDELNLIMKANRLIKSRLSVPSVALNNGWENWKDDAIYNLKNSIFGKLKH